MWSSVMPKLSRNPIPPNFLSSNGLFTRNYKATRPWRSDPKRNLLHPSPMSRLSLGNSMEVRLRLTPICMFHYSRSVQPTVYVRLLQTHHIPAIAASMGIPSWMFGVIMAKSLEKRYGLIWPSWKNTRVLGSWNPGLKLNPYGPLCEAAWND